MAGIERPRPPPPCRRRRAKYPLDEVRVALSSPLLLLPAAASQSSKGLGGMRRLGHHRPGVGGCSLMLLMMILVLMILRVLGVMLRYSQRRSVPCVCGRGSTDVGRGITVLLVLRGHRRQLLLRTARQLLRRRRMVRSAVRSMRRAAIFMIPLLSVAIGAAVVVAFYHLLPSSQVNRIYFFCAVVFSCVRNGM